MEVIGDYTFDRQMSKCRQPKTQLTNVPDLILPGKGQPPWFAEVLIM